MEQLSELSKKQDIALSELITAILSGKIKIIVGTLIFAMLSVAFALYLPNQYKSKSTYGELWEANSCAHMGKLFSLR